MSSIKGKDNEFFYKELSHEVIGACFAVHSQLGCGLPEHCYNKALMVEFKRREIFCTYQEQFDVHYCGAYVGHFVTDLVVDSKIILELKAVEGITPGHQPEFITYLTISGLRVGYVVNFGVRSLQFKRLVRTFQPSL